jgi:hypothetical protein
VEWFWQKHTLHPTAVIVENVIWCEECIKITEEVKTQCGLLVKE